MASTNHIIDNALLPWYPPQPGYNTCCPVNQIYQTLPPSSPNFPTQWETTAVGPSSIKHIYSGVPNWYPIRKITRPVGTLYEHDYSQFNETGVGVGKRRSYHYKAYPLTNRDAKEVTPYADYLLPYMDPTSWTHYPVIRDATVNSSLQIHPYPYVPDRT